MAPIHLSSLPPFFFKNTSLRYILRKQKPVPGIYILGNGAKKEVTHASVKTNTMGKPFPVAIAHRVLNFRFEPSLIPGE